MDTVFEVEKEGWEDVKPKTQEEQETYETKVLSKAQLLNVGYKTAMKMYKHSKIKKRSFYRRKKAGSTQAVGQMGGRREGSGAKRKGHINGEPRKKVLDRDNKKKQRIDVKFAWTDAYREFTFPPSTKDVSKEIDAANVDMAQLEKNIPFCFHGQRDEDYANDRSLISDKMDGETYISTGQRRRVLFASVCQRANEPGIKGLDKMFITKKWVKKQLGFTNFVKDVRVIADICKKAVDNRLKEVEKEVAPGYPHLQEMELLFTPQGAPPQDAHADTRFNMVSTILRLDKGSVKATWTATKSSFMEAKPGTPMKELKYEQLPLDTKKIEVLINHNTWPHYGPGNSSGVDRYCFFFTFAVDEASKRHTTSEEVLNVV